MIDDLRQILTVDLSFQLFLFRYFLVSAKFKYDPWLLLYMIFQLLNLYVQ